MNSKKAKITIASLVLISFAAIFVFGLNKNKEKNNLVIFKSTIEHTERKPNRFDEFGPDARLKLGAAFETDKTSYFRFLSEWDEQDYKVIEKSLISPLIAAIKTKKLNSLNQLSKNANDMVLEGLIIGNGNLNQTNMADGIQEFSWNTSNRFQGTDQIKNALEKYTSAFSEIQYVDMVAREVLSPVEKRGPNAEMLKAQIHLKYDLRGLGVENKIRRQDRGDIIASVTRIKGNEWSLDKIQFVKGETLTKETPAFLNATHTVGLDNIKSYLRKEAIRRGGYALSLTDVDKDGMVDMLVGSMGETQLLKGQADGRFVRTPSALDKETLVKSAVFADYRNKGTQDLLIVRFEPSKFIKGQANEEVVIYENDGKGDFKKNENAFRKSIDTASFDHAMPAAVGDYNNDGLLDIYVGFPGNKDFTFMGAHNVTAPSGKRVQGLYLNHGDGSYIDSSKAESTTGIQLQNNPGGSLVYPHSALAADFDRNGFMDILVIDDMGNLSPMYKNSGDGKFNQSAQRIGLTNNQIGMSASIGDFNNDGVFDVMMTNVTFNAAQRLNASSLKNYFGAPYSPADTYGLRLFQGQKEKNGEVTYEQKDAGLDLSGEGLAGLEFIDYNNDGLLDIYVTNGLWSGTTEDKSQDLSSLYSRAGTAAALFIKMFADDNKDSKKTSSFLMRILQSFKGDIATPDRLDPKGDRPSLAGFQRNKLFRNNGNGTFSDVGFLEGVDSVSDGYIVALSDLNKDGKMDVVLRNADPGSVDNKFGPVEVFLNQTTNGNQSVILTFESTSGNKDAIGVTAEADIGGKTLTRQLIANNGTAQSEKLLHFGLGNKNSIDELRVLWPSGKMQTLKNIPAGRHHLIEPKVVIKSASNP